KQDIANLSIHLRTKKEMSKFAAHWDLIPEIKKLRDEVAPNTLLTINGDIPDRQTGMELVEQYGVDGVMIGRGVFKNPFAFEKNSKMYPRLFRPQRRFFKIYVNGFRGASELRNQLMQTDSTAEVRALLDVYE